MKTGLTCPVRIRALIFPKGRVKARAWTTHRGHAVQLECLRLPQVDRERVAGEPNSKNTGFVTRFLTIKGTELNI